ncbi:MAG TPA: universal stress protein [Candidatus Tectomicrobia bacterium]
MSTQHFLVPIDFSEYADYALDYAMALARKLPARLTLLHVIHAMPVGVTDMGTALPYSYLQDLEAEIAQNLQGYLKRVQDANLEGDTVVVHGVPFDEIVQTAKTKNINLIIMGSHGRTGLGRLFLGSVAEKVVRLAPCPVLVTRQATQVPA